MGFLDNLENNLKSLESREEAQDGREQTRRHAAREQALAAAPWAEQLKRGAFTGELLRHATRLGFERPHRRPAPPGSARRCGWRRARGAWNCGPRPEGVVAVFIEDGNEVSKQPVDLAGSAEALARTWLG